MKAVKSSSDTLTQPIEVLVKETSEKKEGGRKKAVKKKIGYAALTRFAAHQLYAPGRLLKSLPGTHRIPIERTSTSYLIMGKIIDATPIASWKSGKLYVTAVELKNASSQLINLDARVIRGQWLTATFHDTVLHPAGSETDNTAVYLVSDRPYHEARRI